MPKAIPMPRPAIDRPELRALCAELVPNEIPVVLQVDAPSWAERRWCTRNVDLVIADHGGSVEYGWEFLETIPNVLLEAQFHAVWIDDVQERRHDVTPKDIPGVTETVFLPDRALVYDGRQIPNVRRALVDDPLVDELIETLDAWFEMTNRGELADFHGELTPTPEMRENKTREEELAMTILTKYFG
jgi:hypothetical protein